MLETLKERKAALEAQGQKGFTLMEMLIVIAIIAILIAIAIPIFTQQLDRANAATDEANIRSGYAQVQSEIMLDKTVNGNDSYILNSDGTVTKGSTYKEGVSYKTGGSSANLGLGDQEDPKIGGVTASWVSNQYITYAIDEDDATGELKISEIEGNNP